MSFIGDYPIEHQKYWDDQFEQLESAKIAAREQHNERKKEYDDLYTIVIDPEKSIEDDVMWIIYKDEEFEALKAQELADDLGSAPC
jgi:hypothetical protein